MRISYNRTSLFLCFRIYTPLTYNEILIPENVNIFRYIEQRISLFAWVLIDGETTARLTKREKYMRPWKKNCISRSLTLDNAGRNYFWFIARRLMNFPSHARSVLPHGLPANSQQLLDHCHDGRSPTWWTWKGPHDAIRHIKWEEFQSKSKAKNNCYWWKRACYALNNCDTCCEIYY